MNSHKSAVLSRLIGELDAQNQSAFAQFLDDKGNAAIADLFAESASRYAASEAAHAAKTAKLDRLQIDLQRLASFEVKLANLEKGIVETLAAHELREQQALAILAAKHADELRQTARSHKYSITALLALSITAQIGFAFIARSSRAHHGEAMETQLVGAE